MDQIAFRIGGLTVYWYGILVAVGFVVGLWTATRRGLNDGVRGEWIADLGLWLLIGALVGSRALHIVYYWQEEFAPLPSFRQLLLEMIALNRGGLVFHGGLIGASLATVIYARVRRLPLWKLADALAPSIALGHVFGRIGCFVNGCCYGLPTHLPWAIRYPADHLSQGVPVHPAQLYEAAMNLVFYVGLAWQYRRKRFAGETFALYLVGYGVLRFGLEFFRGDYEVRHLGGWATAGQLLSVLVVLAGIGLHRLLRPPQG